MTQAVPKVSIPTDLHVFHQQIEDLLKQAENPQTQFSDQINNLFRIIVGMWLWNDQMKGTNCTWDKEPDREYANVIVRRISKLFQTISVGFSQHMLGLNWINEPTVPDIHQTPQITISPANPETADTEPTANPSNAEKTEEPKTKPINRKEAEKIALTTVTGVKGRSGKLLRGGGTVAGNQRAIEFVNLLHRSGGLTADQLRFLATFKLPLGPAAGHEVQETLKLLKSTRVPFVDSKEQKGWKGSPTSINYLTQAGEMYYSSLPAERRESRVGDANVLINLNHHYGTQQVLSCIAGACSLSSLDLIASFKEQTPAYEPSAEKLLQLQWYSCVELESVVKKNTPVRTEYTSSYIKPDAIGTIVLEAEVLSNSLLHQAGLANVQSSTPSKYAYVADPSGGTSYHWNFILEYDENTEDLNFFSQKADKYIKLLNTDSVSLWPAEWRKQFPAAILVVTSGGAVRALNMLLAVSKRLEDAKKQPHSYDKTPKVPDNWLFTTTDWFKTAYAPFIGSFNKGAKLTRSPLMGKVWLPLPEVMEVLSNQTPAEKKMHMLKLDKNIKAGVRSKGLLADKLVALPLYHTKNASPVAKPATPSRIP
jgi:hypothetical protein